MCLSLIRNELQLQPPKTKPKLRSMSLLTQRPQALKILVKKNVLTFKNNKEKTIIMGAKVANIQVMKAQATNY